jgi:membrane-bound lytic murein transglycosylase B
MEIGEGLMGERRPGGDRFRRQARRLFSAGLGLVLSGLLAAPLDAAPQRPSLGDRSFRAFIASLWPIAAERGVKRQTFDRAFAGVVFDRKVVASASRQAEFVIPLRDYIASAVSPGRIARGREKSKADDAWLIKASKTFGVDEGVIMGIWGIETDFGEFPGTDNVIQSLASLAYVRFRGEFFRDELLAALAIAQEGDISPRAMRGSWAGAMGQTQFMPSSYLVFAVDFEGHGKRDIWKSEADAIGSTANFLASNGWRPDLPWGFEVRLPAGFALTEADSSTRSPFANFAARGVRRADGLALPEKGEGRLLIPAGLKGPVFLITSNFEVIKTYNASTSYALAVALLGDAIEGGRTLVADWPMTDPPLGQHQVRRLQTRLKQLGYDPGEVDGLVGDSLRAAVRAYQERHGLTPDGDANLALLRRIDREK